MGFGDSRLTSVWARPLDDTPKSNAITETKTTKFLIFIFFSCVSKAASAKTSESYRAGLAVHEREAKIAIAVGKINKAPWWNREPAAKPAAAEIETKPNIVNTT